MRVEWFDEIMAFCNSFGESETCAKYNINSETLHRYQRERRFRETKQAKILLLDVETSFMEVRVWGLYKQRIPHTNVISDWHFLSWSCKWLFDSKIESDVLTPREAVHKDDKRICESLWQYVNDADIIIGHNVNKFDMRKINTRFILNGLKPTMPYLTIDTLKIAQKNFAFSSNKLDYLGKLFFKRGKIETDYDLWIKCEEGDKESLDKMVAYNQEDIRLLEDLYLELRPFIKSHPNIGVVIDAQEPCCPNCGSFEFEEGEGYYTTPQNRYISVRCKSCGAVNRKKDSLLTADQRKNLIVPTAR
jgi:DNA polymerase elongation subunit (family B)